MLACVVVIVIVIVIVIVMTFEVLQEEEEKAAPGEGQGRRGGDALPYRSEIPGIASGGPSLLGSLASAT